MNVLSLFNGMSFGYMALESLDVKVDKYYSSEIDKYANKATETLYPDVIQLGDVMNWRAWWFELGEIDLLLAGFPCQAWSMAGKMKGDNDPRGALVHDLIDIWKQINLCRAELGKEPVKFMFENVKMKKEFLDYINNLFGVEPICINSALVSAQNRVRYYWTNIDGVEQPEDRNIFLWDIIEDGFVDSDKSFCIDANYFKGGNLTQYFKKSRRQLVFCGAMRGRYIVDGKCQDSKQLTAGLTKQRIEVRYDGKTNSLTTVQKDNNVVYGANGEPYFSLEDIEYRKLTPRECFRLQTVPEYHINTLLESGISNTQLYKMCGNGWTMEVVKHIFKNLRT